MALLIMRIVEDGVKKAYILDFATNNYHTAHFLHTSMQNLTLA
jgi:hypothetical protein